MRDTYSRRLGGPGFIMFNIGDIALALAGRDSGRCFVIVGISDESYVFIANGRSRKADSPKKKKIKHLKLIKKAEEGFVVSLNLKNGKFTNSVLKKIISEYSGTV